MDLRWGLREESQDNHTVIEFCLQEIDNCAKMSLGPSFVVCLSLLIALVSAACAVCVCLYVCHASFYQSGFASQSLYDQRVYGVGQ